jgi:hypothetical protein
MLCRWQKALRRDAKDMFFKIILKNITALAVAVAIFPATPAHAERRLALVIGNGKYALAPLANAVNDARLMANRLQAQRFEVSSYYNATQKKMKQDRTSARHMETRASIKIVRFWR